MIFEGLGALGSDVGVQGRFLVKNGRVIRQKPHPFRCFFSFFLHSKINAFFDAEKIAKTSKIELKRLPKVLQNSTKIDPGASFFRLSRNLDF